MKDVEARRYWIGFDLGATKMLATLFHRDFAAVAAQRKKTKAQEGADAGLKRIVELIREVLDKAGVKPSELLGIGIGSPGPLDLNTGVLLHLPNMGWRRTPLKARLEAEFDCPAVVCNDVDAGTFGEYRFGAAQGARCVVGIFPGTGIGGGCVYEGSLLRGKKHSALEIGHCLVLPEGPRCGCGRRGCLEAVAGRLAVASAAMAAAQRGEAPHLLAEAGMNFSNLKSGTLAAAIKAGDRAVERIVRDAARWVGVAAGSVVNLLLPDVMVLGGGMVEAMPDIFLEEVSRAAREHVMPAFENTFKVVVAGLGDDATALGAAAWAERVVLGAAERKS